MLARFAVPSLVLASAFAVGCSAIASATSYTKHTDGETNGELGQLFATHGDHALGDAAVPTPRATYALTIVRNDAYDQKCNSVGLAPQSLKPLSGGKVGIPFPDESCTAPPPLPDLDFVDGSCDVDGCVVATAASDDATHLALTVTVPTQGDARVTVHVRRRDTGADLVDRFVVRARVPDAIAVYPGDRTSPVSRAVFDGATMNWCMALKGGGLTVEIPESQPWGVAIDGATVALREPLDAARSCFVLQAAGNGQSTVHLTGGGVSRDVNVQVALRSNASKVDLYTLKSDYRPEQQNDIEVDPVGEPFVTHAARPTRDAEVSFSLVSVVTLADGTTALGGASSTRAAHLEAADPSIHADDANGDDAYLSIDFLFPVKTTIRGIITAQLAGANLVFPMTVQAE